MKHFFSLSLLLIVGLFVFNSCSNDETYTSNDMNTQSKCQTLRELQEFNQKILSGNQTRGWFSNALEIASGDILGAAAGVAAAQTFISFAGVATGGTGALVTGAICGSICGASASAKTYNRLRATRSTYPTIIEDTNFLVIADNAYKSNLVVNNNNSLGQNDVTFVYNKAFDKIQMPERFMYIKRIGEDHNGLINAAFSVAQGNTMVQELPIGSFRNILPSLEIDSVILNEVIFENPKFVDEYNKINVEVENCISGGELNVDKFISGNSFISERVEEALKEYISLFCAYPNNVDEVAEITNGYIEIIEKNNEFTDKEKEIVYAAITVALYSPQIWNDFE